MLSTSEAAIGVDTTKCIQNCRDCYNICIQTAEYCIQMGGEYVESGRLESLMDCADTCRAGANFMAQGSSLQAHTCNVCMEECERCAQLCAEFETDAQMQACTEECQRCIESCREMARLKMYVPDFWRNEQYALLTPN